MEYKPDLPPEQKLDIVLQQVVNMSQQEPHSYMYIANLVGANDYWKEVFEILIKLRKDGYIASPDETGYAIYVSNFDGRLFIDNGGYTTKALKDANDALLVQLEINRRIELDAHLKNAASRLNLLTLWLAIGTGALALIEVIKFLCEMDSCIKEFFERML